MHPQPTSFGRRQHLPPLPPLGHDKRSRKVGRNPSEKPPRPASKAAAKPPSSDANFAAWRRSQAAGSMVFWLASLALMAPGIACFLAQAPLTISIAVEIAGLVLGGWLRRERRRRLAAIVAWDADETQT